MQETCVWLIHVFSSAVAITHVIRNYNGEQWWWWCSCRESLHIRALDYLLITHKFEWFMKHSGTIEHSASTVARQRRWNKWKTFFPTRATRPSFFSRSTFIIYFTFIIINNYCKLLSLLSLLYQKEVYVWLFLARCACICRCNIPFDNTIQSWKSLKHSTSLEVSLQVPDLK